MMIEFYYVAEYVCNETDQTKARIQNPLHAVH